MVLEVVGCHLGCQLRKTASICFYYRVTTLTTLTTNFLKTSTTAKSVKKMNAKQCLSETTWFQRERTRLAGTLARMVAAGVNSDSSAFRATFARFAHNRLQLSIQSRLRDQARGVWEWQK